MFYYDLSPSHQLLNDIILVHHYLPQPAVALPLSQTN